MLAVLVLWTVGQADSREAFDRGRDNRRGTPWLQEPLRRLRAACRRGDSCGGSADGDGWCIEEVGVGVWGDGAVGMVRRGRGQRAWCSCWNPQNWAGGWRFGWDNVGGSCEALSELGQQLLAPEGGPW
jgi:hypothetical protein